VQHRILGSTVILAGVVKGLDNLRLAKGNWAAVGWLLLLVLASVELFLYVEASGVSAPLNSLPASPPGGPGGHGGH
jgi:hypothetical protein